MLRGPVGGKTDPVTVLTTWKKKNRELADQHLSGFGRQIAGPKRSNPATGFCFRATQVYGKDIRPSRVCWTDTKTWKVLHPTAGVPGPGEYSPIHQERSPAAPDITQHDLPRFPADPSAASKRREAAAIAVGDVVGDIRAHRQFTRKHELAKLVLLRERKRNSGLREVCAIAKSRPSPSVDLLSVVDMVLMLHLFLDYKGLGRLAEAVHQDVRKLNGGTDVQMDISQFMHQDDGGSFGSSPRPASARLGSASKVAAEKRVLHGKAHLFGRPPVKKPDGTFKIRVAAGHFSRQSTQSTEPSQLLTAGSGAMMVRSPFKSGRMPRRDLHEQLMLNEPA